MLFTSHDSQVRASFTEGRTRVAEPCQHAGQVTKVNAVKATAKAAFAVGALCGAVSSFAKGLWS